MADFVRKFLLIMAVAATLIPLPSGALAAATLKAQEITFYRGLLSKVSSISPAQLEKELAKGNSNVMNQYVRSEFLRLRSAQFGPAPLYIFLKQNPEWPLAEQLRTEAEFGLPPSVDSKTVKDFFESYPPLTWAGKRKLADIYAAEGKMAEATPILKEYWQAAKLDNGGEKAFLRRYADAMTQQDQQNRLDFMINIREWDAARRQAARMGKPYQDLLQARQALMQGKKNAQNLVDKVPANLQNNPGLLLNRVSYRRSRDMTGGAIELLAKQPKDMGALADNFWKEREVLTRRLLKQRDNAGAYKLASSHNLPTGVSYAEAEFLSGWISLRKLDKPEAALSHFQNLYKNTRGALSKSRAAFWLGTSYAALNDQNNAQIWFARASEEPTTFYGQLARQYRSDKGKFELVSYKMRETDQDVVLRNSITSELAHALEQVNKLDPNLALLLQPRKQIVNKDELNNLLETANEIGRPDLAVSLMRFQKARGSEVFPAAYPTISLPKLDTALEPALIYAIIRQESNFDPGAVSQVGAKGLMQVMPSVAHGFAKKNRIAFKRDWLLSKPDVNIRLGVGLLEYKVGRFKDNYAMAIAAYNAGPSRVQQWIKEYGDPRQNEISMIDWIESIPFEETRNYVQRVLENVVVYRYLIDNSDDRPPIEEKVAQNFPALYSN